MVKEKNPLIQKNSTFISNQKQRTKEDPRTHKILEPVPDNQPDRLKMKVKKIKTI